MWRSLVAVSALSTIIVSGLSTATRGEAAPAAAAVFSRTSCGGGIVAINVTVPKEFNADALSNAQLISLGYPPRPRDQRTRATWERFVRHPLPHTSCQLRNGHPGHGPVRVNRPAEARPNNLPPQQEIAYFNWSGNVADDHTYNDIQAYWTVPLGSANPGDQAYSSSWVGFGQGASASLPLIQAGSESDDVLGSHAYYLWWEVTPPLNSQQVITSDVTAGDTVYTQITAATNSAKFQVFDLTKETGGTYNINGSFSLAGTAEWILERTDVGFFPHLANSTTTFTTAAAAAPGVSLTGVGNLPHYYGGMYTCDLKTVMAMPGSISSDGYSFTDYWENYGDIIQHHQKCPPS